MRRYRMNEHLEGRIRGDILKEIGAIEQGLKMIDQIAFSALNADDDYDDIEKEIDEIKDRLFDIEKMIKGL